jgi:hypothetical protein
LRFLHFVSAHLVRAALVERPAKPEQAQSISHVRHGLLAWQSSDTLTDRRCSGFTQLPPQGSPREVSQFAGAVEAPVRWALAVRVSRAGCRGKNRENWIPLRRDGYFAAMFHRVFGSRPNSDYNYSGKSRWRSYGDAARSCLPNRAKYSVSKEHSLHYGSAGGVRGDEAGL